MQFVVDSSEELVLRFSVAIAAVVKHGGHIWRQGSHVGASRLLKAITPLAGPTNFSWSWLRGGSRCRHLPKTECFRTAAEHMHLSTASQWDHQMVHLLGTSPVPALGC